jgi:hypothetical protein
VVYGYDEKLAVYFNQGPLFTVNRFGGLFQGFGGGQGAPQARASGRGGPNESDVIQGRPVAPPAPPQSPDQPSPEFLELARNYLPGPGEQPRTAVRFAPESELLISGLLTGGRELAGKPAVVTVPRGKGNYLLFAINPMWREGTQGSFMLMMNAAMNYESLNVGRTQ